MHRLGSSRATNGTRRYPASKSPGTSPHTSPRWQVPTSDGARRHPGSKSPVTSPHTSPRWQVPPADVSRRQRTTKANTGTVNDSGSKSPSSGWRNGAYPSSSAQSQVFDTKCRSCDNTGFDFTENPCVVCEDGKKKQAVLDEFCEVIPGRAGAETSGLYGPATLPTPTSKIGAKKVAPPPIPASKAGSRWQRERDRLGSYVSPATRPSEEGIS